MYKCSIVDKYYFYTYFCGPYQTIQGYFLTSEYLWKCLELLWKRDKNVSWSKWVTILPNMGCLSFVSHFPPICCGSISINFDCTAALRYKNVRMLYITARVHLFHFLPGYVRWEFTVLLLYSHCRRLLFLLSQSLFVCVTGTMGPRVSEDVVYIFVVNERGLHLITISLQCSANVIFILRAACLNCLQPFIAALCLCLLQFSSTRGPDHEHECLDCAIMKTNHSYQSYVNLLFFLWMKLAFACFN